MVESNSTSSADIPKFGRLVQSIEEFYKITKYVAHFAVKRSLGYFHHYIVAGWFDAKNKVFEYYVCFKNFFTGPGQVAKNDISEEEIEEAIAEENLYVIEAPNYPKTEYQKEQAKARCWKRLGEKAYTLASNNCEHLVNYIMTGLPYSEQIMNAGVWKMIFVDSFDNVVCRGKRNFVKLGSCLLAVKPASAFVKIAVNEVLNVATELIPSPVSNTANSAGRCATNLCKAACKNSQYTKSQLLASKECVDVAKTASKTALRKTAGATFIITGLIEGGMAAYEIRKLRKQRKNGFLSKRNFRREVTKSVSGAVSATAGTVAGGVIGQALCPIPVLGFAIGSALGNFFGRWIGSAASGQVFDIIT
ncbi:uncharacterized protein LOC133176579 [Saccostrea echinata]|uniref:uncharacterized protein LOC133176579 n=1 Tax=Saccostrea echinata TaxID=191078 RepID=UPI002A83E728|nr:uncharacterized protein LOC133176579 [Saccostrea echinata]